MCVKLIRNEKSCDYDCEKTLMAQMPGCTEIQVQYRPNDESIEKFLKDIQDCAKFGLSIDPKVKISVEYGNFLSGYKTKKQIAKAISDISLNEVIKLMTLMQRGVDKKLEEIHSLITER